MTNPQKKTISRLDRTKLVIAFNNAVQAQNPPKTDWVLADFKAMAKARSIKVTDATIKTICNELSIKLTLKPTLKPTASISVKPIYYNRKLRGLDTRITEHIDADQQRNQMVQNTLNNILDLVEKLAQKHIELEKEIERLTKICKNQQSDINTLIGAANII
jgi:hypothetical protein